MGFFHFSLKSSGEVYASLDFVFIPYALPNLIGDIFMFFYRQENVKTHVVVGDAMRIFVKLLGISKWIYL